jgi:ABC-2 type transport system permease protein
MERIIFFLLRIFHPLVARSGADIEQVRLIVKYKMMMDNRKSLNPNNTKKDPDHTLWFQYFMYLLFGVIVAAIIGEGKSAYTALFFGYTFLIFMLSVNMIADFSTVLFDTRDNTIIIPRPVSEATYLLSRIVHISGYLLDLPLPLQSFP